MMTSGLLRDKFARLTRRDEVSESLLRVPLEDRRYCCGMPLVAGHYSDQIKNRELKFIIFAEKKII